LSDAADLPLFDSQSGEALRCVLPVDAVDMRRLRRRSGIHTPNADARSRPTCEGATLAASIRSSRSFGDAR
jgi:hypothetical protein